MNSNHALNGHEEYNKRTFEASEEADKRSCAALLMPSLTAWWFNNNYKNP